MGQARRRRRQRSAGAFLGDGRGNIAIPMSTLADEYHDEPAEPVDSDVVPEPDPPGLVARLIKRVRRTAWS